MKKILAIAFMIWFSSTMAQADDTKYNSALATIASATLDQMTDDEGVSVYQFCRPKAMKEWNSDCHNTEYCQQVNDACQELRFGY